MIGKLETLEIKINKHIFTFKIEFIPNRVSAVKYKTKFCPIFQTLNSFG